MTRLSLRAMIATLAATALLLAGCATQAPTSEQPADPNAVFNYAAGGDVNSLDPTVSTLNFVIGIISPAYEGLVRTNSEGELEPLVADAYDVSEDGRTFTFHLREGVVFHDGTALDAEAVKTSLEYGKREGSTVSGELASIQSIEVVDDLVLEIVVNESGGAILDALSNRPGYLMSPAAIEGGELGTHPVGTGPYAFGAYVPAAELSYVRNADYWGGAPPMAGVRIQFMTDNTAAINALRTGTIDATQITSPIGSDNSFDVTTVPTVTVHHLILSRAYEEFEDVRVRQAIAHAIDVPGIIAVIGAGVQSSQYAGVATPYYSDQAPAYEFDPELSKELLNEAGYAEGFAFQMYYTSSAQAQEIAEIIQANLADVGITAELIGAESTALVATCWVDQSEDCDATYGAYTTRIDTANFANLIFGPAAIANMGRNVEGSLSSEITDAIAAAQAPWMDIDDHIASVQALNETLATELPNIVLFNSETTYGTGSDVLNFEVDLTLVPNWRILAKS